jgi:hypothetical protein
LAFDRHPKEKRAWRSTDSWSSVYKEPEGTEGDADTTAKCSTTIAATPESYQYHRTSERKHSTSFVEHRSEIMKVVRLGIKDDIRCPLTFGRRWRQLLDSLTFGSKKRRISRNG